MQICNTKSLHNCRSYCLRRRSGPHGKKQPQIQEKLNRLNNEIDIAGIEVPFPKTKSLAVSDAQESVEMESEALKTVTHFKYLGIVITTDSDLSKTVSANCVNAKVALCKLRPALTSIVMKMNTKMLIIEIFIKPVLLYGLEILITRKVDMIKLNPVLNKNRRKISKLKSKSDLKRLN